jgi:hypothetical protein
MDSRQRVSRCLSLQHIPTHLGVELRNIAVTSGKVHLSLAGNNGSTELEADDVIGGTGCSISFERLRFLNAGLRKQIRAAKDTPVLNKFFESSAPELYFVGCRIRQQLRPAHPLRLRSYVHLKTVVATPGQISRLRVVAVHRKRKRTNRGWPAMAGVVT